MFMQFSGLQGQYSRVFGINHPTGGGVHILIFVSCLRLDGANRTVVLDTAVLPLTNRLMPQIHQFLAALSSKGFCNIKVDEAELKLWKQIIPALVERCRQWQHRPSCEYWTKSQIPLSLENGQTPLCSCGNGNLPAKFIPDIPQWNTVAKYAIRAAISPSFSIPFVEQIFDASITEELPDFNGDKCKVCGESTSKSGTDLLQCARCRAVKYCSIECQRADWKNHKKWCGK
jgi:hypothetical protein